MPVLSGETEICTDSGTPELLRGPRRGALMAELGWRGAKLPPPAQGAALATAVTRMIDALDREVSGAADLFPELLRIWEAEADILAAVEAALRGGQMPDQVPGLAGIQAPSPDWTALASLARGCVAFPGRHLSNGHRVCLEPGFAAAALLA